MNPQGRVGCRRALTMVAAFTVAMAATAVASAAPTRSAGTSSRSQPLGVYKHYTQVNSGNVTAPAGLQVAGEVACPSGTTVVGGGVDVDSDGGLPLSVNTSIPFDNGWEAYVNNASSANDLFAVFAFCVKKVSGYSVVTGTTVTNPAGSETQTTVSCPSKTVVLSGGAVASSSATGSSLHSSYPDGKSGWIVQANNATSSDQQLTPYVICAKKPSGYTLVSAAPVSVPPGHDTPEAFANCPSNTSVLGGGIYASLESTSVTLHAVFPANSMSAVVYENNGAGISVYEYAYAICAKTTS